ncbi:MAG: hypothetical protein KJ607_14515, partial [Bacteroidetes bacterium]|nr:hypothetical protein [Bacteroidota bacterium]
MMDYTEEIHRYLHGEMNPEETCAFEKRMQQEKELAYHVSLYRTVLENIESGYELYRLYDRKEREECNKLLKQEGISDIMSPDEFEKYINELVEKYLEN